MGGTARADGPSGGLTAVRAGTATYLWYFILGIID